MSSGGEKRLQATTFVEMTGLSSLTLVGGVIGGKSLLNYIKKSSGEINTLQNSYYLKYSVFPTSPSRRLDQ